MNERANQQTNSVAETSAAPSQEHDRRGTAFEVDGGQHGERQKEDIERTQKLEQAGFRVLRFWNNDVLRDMDAVTEEIWRALQRTPPPSRPSP